MRIRFPSFRHKRQPVISALEKAVNELEAQERAVYMHRAMLAQLHYEDYIFWQRAKERWGKEGR